MATKGDIPDGPSRLIAVSIISRIKVMVMVIFPDSKVHGANMGSTWVLSAPDGPHVGPMNLAIMVNLLRTVPSFISIRDIEGAKVVGIISSWRQIVSPI